MRKNTTSLQEIKQKILSLKGTPITVHANRGRKRFEDYLGVIDNVYPSVFTIKLKNSQTQDNLTCSYSDVLCGDIVIDVEKI